MITRKEYIEKKKKELDGWDWEITKLEAKSAKMKEDIRDKYQKNILILRNSRKKAESQLDSLKTATEDSWKKLKAETENIWLAMTDSMSAFSAHF